MSFDAGATFKPNGPTFEQNGPVIEDAGPSCDENAPIVEHEGPSSGPNGTFSSRAVTTCKPNGPIVNHEGPAIEDEGPFTEDVVPLGVELLEESFAVCRRDDEEMGVCEALISALRRRDLRIAADVLGRIATAEPPLGWLSWSVVEILGNSNPREFEAILRRAAIRSSHGKVRGLAAERLVIAGLATPSEIDAFQRDPDDAARRMTARGLAALGTPDALIRITEIALRHDDYRDRRHAWTLLGLLKLTPARGGRC